MVIGQFGLMRIISGHMRGLQLVAPKDLPVRPTTDIAKESLFNILNQRLEFANVNGLDLFSGTGNISFELCSRSCKQVTAVDRNSKCCRYISQIQTKYGLKQLEIINSDVFDYLELSKGKFDLIFADPPYDMPNLFRLPELIFKNNLLALEGIFVLEHPALVQLNQVVQFKENRIYGNSAFSFFYL